MHKKINGNILFVTMILLIVSSIMGLLIVYYMKAMIGLTSNFHDYFQAYYHANGGVEIGLTQIVARQSYGFEKSEASYSEIFNAQKDATNTKQLFPSNNNSSTTRNNTTGSIISFGKVYADDYVFGDGGCDGLNYKNLSQGEPILIPLYYDKKSDLNTFEPANIGDFNSKNSSELSLGTNGIKVFAKGDVAVKIIEGLIEEKDGSLLVTKSSSSDEKQIIGTSSLGTQSSDSNFIAILKTSAGEGSVCIEFPNAKIPLPFYLVSSTSTYGRTRIILQGYKKNERIGEFLYTAIASNSN